MKVIFSTLVLALSLQAGAQSSDPCALAGNIPSPMPAVAANSGSVKTFDFSQDNILKGLALSKERRLKIICEVKSAVLEKYSLIDLKKARLNIDADQLMQQCARDEMAIDSGDRQEFLDRVQKCIAGFHDTHFGGYSRVQRPMVVTAILATDIGGRIYIARQSPLLISRIKAGDPSDFADLEQVLAPGNEITKIDGQPAAAAVAELYPYVNGSSDAFVHLYGATMYFERMFHYPTKKTVTLEIQTAAGDTRTVALPWMAQVGPGNYDAQVKFQRLGLPLVNDLQLRYDPVLHKFSADDGALWTVGYDPRAPLFAGVSPMTTYNDDSGQPGLRTAEVVLDKDHVFCYMQLLTFASAKFTKTGTKDPQDFFAPIEKFVATCEMKQMPLILDLKFNGGGNGNFPPQLLSVLTEKGKTYPGTLSSYRVTPSLVDLLTNDLSPSDSGARNLNNGADIQTVLQSLSDALGKGAPYTDIINWQDVTADPGVGGFSQKMVAIVTPYCVSACDMTARLLKNSGRAVLVGTSGNGTGAGFESSETKLNSAFLDSEGQLSFQIPNFLFGVESKTGQPRTLAYDQNKDLLMENVPTVADVQAPMTPRDLRMGGVDLAVSAATELFR